MNAWFATFEGFVHSTVDAPVWVILLLKITAILMAAWLVHLALVRANPRWRVLLWRVTAVGLMALPPVASLLPAINIRVEQAAPATQAVDIPTAAPVPAIDRDIATAFPGSFAGDWSDGPASHRLPPPNKSSDEVGSSSSSQPQATAAAFEKPLPITASRAILAVWLVGVGLFACRLCVGYYGIWRLARCGTQPPSWVRNECLRVARAIGCRGRVEVVQSAAVQSPLLCSLRRPRLLVPAAMCEEAYRADLPAIFAHELAHVRSRDVLWNFGLHLVSVALWFHPFAWRMRRAHLAACELVSDAVSASFVGDVTEYCRTLARVAVQAYASIPATGIAMARRSSISRRFSALKRKVFSLPLRRRSVIGFGLAALLTVAVLGVLQFALAAPPPAEPPPADKAETKTAEKETKPAEKAAEPTKTANAMPKIRSMRVRVLDPAGKPLPGAEVRADIWTKEVKGYKVSRTYTTDAAGVAQVELPKTYFIVRLWARKSPLAAMYAQWEEDELAGGKAIPEDYTFRLESGIKIGGRVLDEQGKPIAGAKVHVGLPINLKPANGDGRTSYMIGQNTVMTDADGRWHVDGVLNNAQDINGVRVSHPDFASGEYWGVNLKDQKAIAMLRSETAILTLKRGIIVQGQVTDPAGKPIKDALIGWSAGNAPIDADGQGRFRLPPMPPGERVLMVIAPGWAPLSRSVNIQAGLPLQEFHMVPGKLIQVRFVDAASKPIPEVYVYIHGWGGKPHNISHPKIPEFTDKNGIWEWNGAPDDLVNLRAILRGYATCELEIRGGAPPRTITLKAEHPITGGVTDAVTGKPIPAFTVIPIDVSHKGNLLAERMNAKVGKDGRLDYPASRSDIPQRLRIEAAGYRTQTGPEFREGDDTPRTQDFRLQPSPPISGLVLDATGHPVAKAEVLMATPTEVARTGDFGFPTKGHMAITDAGGHFSFPNPGESFALVAQADAGFAMATFPADKYDVGTLHLQPWASVRGQFRDGGQPIKQARFYLDPVRLYDDGRPRIIAILHSNTDADGRFEFPRVPPVPVSLSVGLWARHDSTFRSGPSVPLDLKPGQQVELDLGGGPTIVKGKVTLTGNVPADLDCTYSDNYLVLRAPGIAPPPEIAAAGFDVRKGWRSAWRKSIEGLTYLKTLRHWFVKLAPDGAFRISGVPPGEYDLAITVYAKPSRVDLEDLRAQAVVRVTVTAEDAARGELTLPEIAATVVPAPGVGDTPTLSFERADGAVGSLTDFHGRWTVVHSWASWCGRCSQQLPALRELQERFAARKLALLGLSLDEDPTAWKAALKRLNLPWPQGRIAASGDTAVSTFLPTYWLLDPAGKIVARVHDLDELAKSLAERLK